MQTRIADINMASDADFIAVEVARLHLVEAGYETEIVNRRNAGPGLYAHKIGHYITLNISKDELVDGRMIDSMKARVFG